MNRTVGTFLLCLMAFVGNSYSEEASNVSYCLPISPPTCSIEAKWDLFADVLLWKVDEIASWGLKNDFFIHNRSGEAATLVFDQNEKMVLFDWDVGIRTGFSYCFERDRWDTEFSYTWFRTSGKDSSTKLNSTSVVSSALLGEWLTFGNIMDAGRIDWRILLNAIDWEIGRNCTPGKGLMFRPHFGIKGGWIFQTIHSDWVKTSQITSTENIKNDFWGLGPKGGVNSQWELRALKKNYSFHLFSDASFALLGGCWTFKDVQKTSMNSSIVSNNFTTWAGTFVFQGLMGLGWDVKLKNQTNLGIRVGYELQYWFDQLKVFTFLEGTLHAALVLQGGMLDFHVDY